jgi:hypothetical protein
MLVVHASTLNKTYLLFIILHKSNIIRVRIVFFLGHILKTLTYIKIRTNCWLVYGLRHFLFQQYN